MSGVSVNMEVKGLLKLMSLLFRFPNHIEKTVLKLMLKNLILDAWNTGLAELIVD